MSIENGWFYEKNEQWPGQAMGLEIDEIEDFNINDDGSGSSDDINDDLGDNVNSSQEIILTFTNASGEQKKLIIKYINE